MAKHEDKHKTMNKKKPMFFAISLLIPFAFFILLELGLRAFSFGQSVPVFVENPAHSDYLLARPDLMKRYFPYAKNAPAVTMETDFFLAKKPKNGIRIFVQGGSTAAGFPYGLGASLSGTLEQRLRQSMPQHEVEVINTAMSAVNSHTLLDIADDIIAQAPDMVLIYAGHNEFLGIMGASSNFTTSSSFWLTRIMLSLKDFRLFQLFQWLYAELNSAPIGNKTPTTNVPANTRQQNRATMMSKVAVNQSIEYNSDIYKAGLHQFKTNMTDVLAKYDVAGIPVFIASIASNHKDQAPFKTSDIEPEFLSVTSTLRAQSEQLSEQDLSNISTILEKSHSALLHYELGVFLASRSHAKLAAKHYELAIAHDLLKFRAPQAINNIIKEIATQYNANFVDTNAYFKQRSSNGIVGNNLMLEHLHPNLRGYYVINESFYQSIKQANLIKPWTNIGINQAWRQRLVLPSEEYFGFASIQSLKSDYPFVQEPIPLALPTPTDKPQQFGLAYFNKTDDWLTMMEKNLNYYRLVNNPEMTLKTLQILADALPHNGFYSLQVAEMLELRKDFVLAIYYYQQALRAGAQDNAIDRKINTLKQAF
jgi:lysophospholipase L1-like esterase